MKITLKTVVLSLLIGTPISFIVMIMVAVYNYQNRQLLCDAIDDGDTTKATRLLMNGENLNKECIIKIISHERSYYSVFGIEGEIYRLKYPVSVAAWRGNSEILKLLIKKGASVNMSDAVYDIKKRKELSPLEVAVRVLRPSLVEILIENKAEPNPSGNLLGEIETAIKGEGLSEFYESPEVKTKRYEEQEKIRYRSSAAMEMLDLLISHKLVNTNNYSRDDKFPIDNPLDSAVSSGYLILVERLLAYGFRGPVSYKSFPFACMPGTPSRDMKSLYPCAEIANLLISKNIKILERKGTNESFSYDYKSVSLGSKIQAQPQ